MKKEETEISSWADNAVKEITRQKRKEYVCEGMWTPSGYFHIGNARTEIFTPYSVYKALVEIIEYVEGSKLFRGDTTREVVFLRDLSGTYRHRGVRIVRHIEMFPLPGLSHISQRAPSFAVHRVYRGCL